MNPFILAPYAGPNFFCDREEETRHIKSAIKNKRNLTLHSIRRLGKTGLIMHVQKQLAKKYVPVYVDIYDTIHDADFANKLITATIAAIEQRKSILTKALDLFARFRATVVIDPTLGTPTVTLDIKQAQETRQSLQVLWSLIKSDRKHIYQIAIDEFQRISDYPNSNIDATLREASQTIPNIHFIFSGSQKHILTGLFIDATKPLFRSTELMELHPIPYPSYLSFISDQFSSYKKEIHENEIHHILKWNKMHTFYVNYFCHLLFEKSSKLIKEEDIEKIKNHIFLEHEMIYYQIKRLLTPPQWKFLSAVAHENILRQPNSNSIKEKYNLGAGSTINRSIQSLLGKEMIYEQYSSDGVIEYQVYDVYLSKWIVHKAL